MARELAYLSKWRDISFAYRYVRLRHGLPSGLYCLGDTHIPQHMRLYRAATPLPMDEKVLLKRRGHWMLIDTVNGQLLALRERRRKML